MAKPRIFISFDYDHDEGVKIMLAGQADLTDSPFEFKDASLKEPLTGDWKEKVKARLRNCDQVIILCGTSTHTATGVSAELEMAQELQMPYFLLKAYPDKYCYKPQSALDSDKIYTWSWANLKSLINGAR